MQCITDNGIPCLQTWEDVKRKDLSRMIQRALTGFAAGAMIYVVVEELIPEMSEGTHSNIGVLAFSAGFTVMMILDVALG